MCIRDSIWAIVCAAMGSSVAGWASIVCIVCFMSGVQLVCLGVIGEYIGKIYMAVSYTHLLFCVGTVFLEQAQDHSTQHAAHSQRHTVQSLSLIHI